jgi:protein required for attachment to host cells
MKTTWILVADSARARVFEMQDGSEALREIEDFIHNEARARISELRTDMAGRYFGKGERQQGHMAEPHVDPVAHENDMFAKHIADTLEHARSANRFNELYVIAAPKFLGLLRQNIGKSVAALIRDELNKDISEMRTEEISHYVRQLRQHNTQQP